MQQDALDDTVLGGNLRHREQPFVGVAPVLIEYAIHPVTLLLGDEGLILVFVKEGDRTAFDSYRHNADTHILRHHIEQRPSKPVHRPQMGIGTTERRHGLAPSSQLTVSTVRRSHTQIAFTHRQVLLLNGSLTCHIRLSETKEYPEVLIQSL